MDAHENKRRVAAKNEVMGIRNNNKFLIPANAGNVENIIRFTLEERAKLRRYPAYEKDLKRALEAKLKENGNRQDHRSNKIESPG